MGAGGVLFPNAGIARVDAQEFPGFSVFHDDSARIGEVFLDGIEGLHRDDVMFAGCGGQILIERRGLKIREHHHDGSVPLEADGAAEGLRHIGALGRRLVEEDFADQAEGVASAASGRNEEFVPVSEEQEADLVVVLNGTEREDCSNFSREFPFGSGGAENAGGADVNKQKKSEFAFFGELFDVSLPADFSNARGDIPLDEADLVPRLVFADLFKVHAPAFEHAPVLAREGCGHGVARPQLDPADALEDFLSLRSVGCCGWHGQD